MANQDNKIRCGWAGNSPLMIDYHDHEWGVPVRDDDRLLFEFLVLEGAQAGLSWSTILTRRENYRVAFARFEPRKVAAFDSRRKRALLGDAGIIRNAQKIESAIINARKVLEAQEEFGSFSSYLWQFVGGKPIRNSWRTLRQLPALSPESELMSKDMRKRGFTFAGPTSCYAFMQAVGMVNDHLIGCFRYKQLGRKVRK